MDRLMDSLVRGYLKVREDNQGQALAEYALIIGLVALVCILALTALGTNIATALNNIAAKV